MTFSVFFAVAFLATAVISLDLSFSPTNFDFPSIQNHFPKVLGAGDDKQPNTGSKRKITDLYDFVNHFEPRLPSTSGASRSSQQRDAKRHQSGAATKASFSTKETKFMVKHLFEDGEMEMALKDPEFFKKFMVTRNKKLPYGRMLYGGTVLDFDNLKAKTTSLIDTKIELLDNDIKDQVKEWLKTSPKEGKVFTTSGKYKVLDTIQKPLVTDKGEKVLSMSLVEREAQIKISTNSEGHIIHYEAIVEEEGAKPLHESENFAQFEASEVEAMVAETREFNQALGWSRSANKKANSNSDRFAFNDQTPEFKNLAQAFDDNVKNKKAEIIKNAAKPAAVCKPGGRRKRAIGSCAIFIGEDGQVEKILPEEFQEAYDRASGEDKRKLTELAKDHMDKIYNEDATHAVANRKEISKRIQIENTKSHIFSMDIVDNVHDLKKESFHNDFSESIENLHGKVISANVEVKLSSSRLGKKIAHLANTEAVKNFGKGMASMSESFGKYFLAKTVITGIIHGDTTSLAIVGGRVGYDVATEAGVWAGTKFFSGASKVGKFTKVLGKVAGPIGAIADMGLGIWSLTKSVGRLKNATNKYDRNDAIADVVMDSVDIATTAVVTGVSIIFPPLAPVAMVVGLVITMLNQMVNALFHAGNDVSRINSEVPLMDFEKEYVFTSRLFDIFVTRGKDYLDYLFEEEQANSIAVQQNLQVLKENPSLFGIVFPSRTMEYDGGCSLISYDCVNYVLWCWKWGMGIGVRGCDLNKECAFGRLCRDDDGWDDHVYYSYKCTCDRPAKTTFGFPRANSFVDFREKRKIYWERAVPNDVDGAYYKCKPGSEQSEGYKVHEENWRVDYFCENAIALLQPPEKRTTATFMLFDLGNGTDTVYAGNDAPVNVFIVGNGTKHFEGGNGCRNEFMLDEYCETLDGYLVGGTESSDALIVSQNCSKGQWLEFDFGTETVRNQADNLRVHFSGMDEVNGRENETERVTVGCELRKAMLGGGTPENHDKINIPAGDGCKYNLTVLLGNFTDVESKASNGTVSLVVGDSFKSVSAALNVHSKDFLTIPVVFQSETSSQVNVESVVKTGNTLSLAINKMGSVYSMNVTLNFQSEDLEQAIYFTETPPGSLDSILFLTPASPPMFYHSLPETDKKENRERNGSSSTPNLFDIKGESWRVTGGAQDDKFILHTPHFTAIDGKGGYNTLGLHPDIKSETTIDLTNKSQLNNIQIVTGSPEQPVTVITECFTKLVASMGGSKSKSDNIIVPAAPCFERELKIMAIGNTRVDIGSEVGPMERDNVTVIVPASNNASVPIQLEVDVQRGVTKGLIVAVQISHVEWTAKVDWKQDQEKFQVQLKDMKGNGTIALILPKSNPELPYVDISKEEGDEPSGRLWIDPETSAVQVIYELHGEEDIRNVRTISGLAGVSNAFRFARGSWKATGGNETDVFVLLPEAQLGVHDINGGNGDDNLLVLESDSSASPIKKIEKYGVFLEEKFFGFGGYHVLGKIKNVQHVIGRPGFQDEFHVACNTKTVNGRGGANKDFEDIIIIKGNGCGAETETEIHVESFTKVANTAENGLFKYLVSDIFTSLLSVKPLASNFHLIKFGFQPWEKFSQISFDEVRQTIGFWSTGRTDTFPLFRNNASGSSDYTNPTFQFHQAGSNVVADVQVSKEGIIALTFGIHGDGLGNGESVKGLTLDVNRYLLNVTEKRDGLETGGSIMGSSLSSVNQFWIFELESMLNTLDGGDCSECRNYLHLSKSFQAEKDLEIQLNKKGGFIKSSNKTFIKRLLNIHELRGREKSAAHDKVVLSTCDVRQISEAEEIVIQHDKANDCAFNLTMEIGPNTMVWFEDPATRNASLKWNNSTFHYRFTSLRSFDLNGCSSLAWLGPVHNYYLNFTVDDLDWIQFDLDEQQLNYSIAGNEYHHSMILGASYQDPFFSQPSMITRDNFKIQIGRDGSVLFTMGFGSSFPAEEMKTSVMPTFDSIAKALGVTFILQTKSQFLFVGHGNLEGSRNMLENLNNTVSYLGGGGADDTIYDITSLQEDVYIYPGFDLDANQTEFSPLQKQTLDLTNIVFPIRKACKKKYLPSVVATQEKDLVIVMDGYTVEHPGKIIIVGGAQYQVASRMQVLLGHAIMKFVESPVKKDWKIRPAPILIPEGIIYTISKEDVEDNHEIRIVENRSNIQNTSFQCMQNGSDLYVTNIHWEVESHEHQGHFEITTIIVTDFFDNETVSQNLPNVVSGVSLTLPGLNILLEGNRVVSANDVLYSLVPKQVRILEWNAVLQDVNKYTSDGSHDTLTMFNDKTLSPEDVTVKLGNDSKHSFAWELFGGVVGFGLMLLLTLPCCFVIKMKMTRRPGYEQL